MAPSKLLIHLLVSSANILEIPLTADAADKVPSKVATAPDAGAASPPAKSKAIVRKNNLVMEVTWCQRARPLNAARLRV